MLGRSEVIGRGVVSSPRRVFQKRANAFGFVPNLLGVMAEAPIALSAYIDLTGLLGKASLNAVEQQVMMLTASYANACGYCMAAQRTAARMIAMSAPVLTVLRSRAIFPTPNSEAVRSS